MKLRALLVVLLLAATGFAQSIMQDQNTNTWGLNGFASGSAQKYPDIKGTITNQFEVVVKGTAPATLTVTIVGCMRGGTCSSTLATSSGTSSQLLSPSTSNIFDFYQVTTSWTGGDSTTQFVINRTGTVARVPGGGGSGTVSANNGSAGAIANYAAAGGSTTVGPDANLTDASNTLTYSGTIASSGTSTGAACNNWVNGFKLTGATNTGVLTNGSNAVTLCSNAVNVASAFSTAFAINGTANIGFNGGKGQHFVNQAATSDMAGVCTGSTTTCSVTFTTNYTSTPSCVVTPTTSGVTSFIITSQATTGFTVTYAPSAATNFNYICIGNPN